MSPALQSLLWGSVSGGALVYSGANWLLASQGAKHRKLSGEQQPSEQEDAGSGTAIAVVAAIFLSNLPEGLSSAAGMRKAGRTRRYVFLLWTGIVAASGLSALAGYSVFGGFSPFIIAATTAFAAGAILAMIVDTMIPEAFAEAHNGAGMITALGFLASFALTKLAG